MNIDGVEIGHGNPCRLVAEISNNHNGSLDRAIRLIEAAMNSGADFVKFQCYTPSELVALRGDGPAPDPWGEEGWTMRDLYEKAQTPHAWFPDLVQHCDDTGVPWFSSVFGPESFALLESLDCPAYKISALDADQPGLRLMVEESGKPIVVSTHRSGGPGIPWPDCLLHCPPGYPQDPDDIDLGTIHLGGYDGLSYHGTDWTVPGKAVQAGARLVEFHLQLENEPSELEAQVSLNESDVKRLRDVATVSVSAPS